MSLTSKYKVLVTQLNKSPSHELYKKFVQLFEENKPFVEETFTWNFDKLYSERTRVVEANSIHADILFRIYSGSEANRTSDIVNSILKSCGIAVGLDPLNKIAGETLRSIIVVTLELVPQEQRLQRIKEGLSVAPLDSFLNLKMGEYYRIHHRGQEALSHFSIALASCPESNDLRRAILCEIGNVFFSAQNKHQALYFFEKAFSINKNDADLSNQLGVIHTDLRNTGKAISYYKLTIELVKKNPPPNRNANEILAAAHMNMGLAYCYEINFEKSFENYNRALKYNPRLHYAYQNKLLDMNYVSHTIADPEYVSKAHFEINKFFNVVQKCPRPISKGKLTLGFCSGDFIFHPVSFFIKGILENLDRNLFNVICYSAKVTHPNTPNCLWRITTKDTTPKQMYKIISDDKVDVLFDLSGHTGDNKIDVFAMKPVPIQISYLGYPGTSGLSNMDYHIVDKITDSDGITPGPNGVTRKSSASRYSEKLLFTKGPFISYSPSSDLPNVIQRTGRITVGTFNRYNKINSYVVSVWKKLLSTNPDVDFVIKTKEFSTEYIKEQFLESVSEFKDRITILDHTASHADHLNLYNKLDFSLDTFPYAGTTTTCDSLAMGVPVITLFGDTHAQNVSSSINWYSGLKEYITYSISEYTSILKKLPRPNKELVRKAFLDGPVCNTKDFTRNFEELILKVAK